ncbi:MAG TPA: 4a-hydroxytetrahydrobiopterin dehydratase [Elusimicrobiota bacterium]|nr:4a-hydroxytetrahydrobiopterin dehydratase [Elusimicrobiota bacterium]
MRRAHGRRCEPCEGLKGPIGAKEAKALAAELKGWRLIGGKTLRQELVMKDFMAAVRFINAVARAAEAEGHHPDLHLTGYRNLAVELTTHSIGGLSINDFIMAEKITALQEREARPVRRGHVAAV